MCTCSYLNKDTLYTLYLHMSFFVCLPSFVPSPSDCFIEVCVSGLFDCSGIESQSEKASATVTSTVVVQCDGSQRDCCGEYEQ